ncbi:MAG: hypothetical protein K2I70_05345, partial [Bacilli bacterium]|nr:hypothetical protein [Bacilli bacterium]
EVYQEFNHIYPRTTENIAGILEMVDVEDMDVYAVLSSSDIPFSLIDKRVKSIETFDINPLTLRYYYLRKWMLENGILDGKDISYGDIRDIINSSRRYINKDEESSVKFWNVYIDGLNKTFFNLYNAMLFAYVGDRISCCYDDDFSYLLEYLNKISLVFGEIDLASASEEYPSKKYDLVYLSNIMDLKDRLSVQKLCKRVDAMLNSGGQVICTNLVNHPYFDFFKEQKGIFEKKFVYDELFRERIGSTYNVYYRYIKK